MRIRLALTLDVRRDTEPAYSDREAQADALVERAEPWEQHPTVGFTSPLREE